MCTIFSIRTSFIITDSGKSKRFETTSFFQEAQKKFSSFSVSYNFLPLIFYNLFLAIIKESFFIGCSNVKTLKIVRMFVLSYHQITMQIKFPVYETAQKKQADMYNSLFFVKQSIFWVKSFQKCQNGVFIWFCHKSACCEKTLHK